MLFWFSWWPKDLLLRDFSNSIHYFISFPIHFEGKKSILEVTTTHNKKNLGRYRFGAEAEDSGEDIWLDTKISEIEVKKA